MSKVDINTLERQAKARAEVPSGIVSKEVGGKTYFRGPILADWFDQFGECHTENERAARIARNKALGLNESGQTPQQVAESKRRAEFMKKRENLLKGLARLDSQISASAFRKRTEAQSKVMRSRKRRK